MLGTISDRVQLCGAASELSSMKGHGGHGEHSQLLPVTFWGHHGGRQPCRWRPWCGECCDQQEMPPFKKGDIDVKTPASLAFPVEQDGDGFEVPVVAV